MFPNLTDYITIRKALKGLLAVERNAHAGSNPIDEAYRIAHEAIASTPEAPTWPTGQTAPKPTSASDPAGAGDRASEKQ